MEMMELLTRWGLALVFASVLVEQAGLPLPAPPILVAAGALAQDGAMRPELVLAVAVAASLIADHAWFFAGRWRGRQLLAGICRLSLSPDTCVRRTDDLIARHGAPVLLVAKFVPGVSAVSIPTAAAMGLGYRRFLLFDALGCLIWCGAYVGAGMIFSREINKVIDAMASIGGWSLVILVAALALYIGAKVAHRARLTRLHRLVRIDPQELAVLLAADPNVAILDTRSRLARENDARTLPNAIDFDDGDDTAMPPPGLEGKTIVTFCTCPNEASAALLAERLLKAGHTRVRVLTGGGDALAAFAGG